jgi:hypothetical protein
MVDFQELLKGLLLGIFHLKLQKVAL